MNLWKCEQANSLVLNHAYKNEYYLSNSGEYRPLMFPERLLKA